MIKSFTDLALEQKVGQLFFIGIPGPEMDDATRALLDQVSPGGVCLFARNIREVRQTRDLLDALVERSTTSLLLSVDQEGGLVDRFRRIMTPMPSASKMRSAGDAARLGSIVGESLKLLGFNMDFAPVIDVVDETRAKHPNGLLSRQFGESKEEVVEFAGSFLKGLQSHVIFGCLKHFPGLGAAQVDSHEELPEVAIAESEFEDTDLYPYRELLERADSVMVAHAAYPRLSLQERDQSGRLLPSSLSSNFITSLLRGRLGFDGLVITDDLEMGAIIKNYGIGEASKMALAAGADMLAICADADAIRMGYQAVLTAIKDGEMSESRLNDSVERVLRLKKRLPARVEFDGERLTQLSSEVAAFNEELAR